MTKKIKTLIFLLTILNISSLDAYFNEDNYDESDYNYNNYNSYSFYKKGINDTFSLFNDESSNIVLDNEIVNNLDKKYLILKEINKNSFDEYVFIRSLSKKITNQYPISVLDGKNRVYIILGQYSDRNSAETINKNFKNYNINSFVSKPQKRIFTYYAMFPNSVKDNLKNSLNSMPTKIVVVEKEIFLNNGSNTKSYKNNSKTRKTAKHYTTNKKAAATTATAVAAVTAKDSDNNATATISINKKECLSKLENTLLKTALFNLETRQIKYNNKIYSVGDSIKFNCIDNDQTDFKINKAIRDDKKLSFVFDNFTAENEIMTANIQCPEGFVYIEDLFYNPDTPQGAKTIETATKTKPQPQTANIATTIDNYKIDNNASVKNTQNAQENKDIHNSGNQEYKSLTGTSRAECSFKVSDGIRTQLVADDNKQGEYKIEPIETYYKDKILKIDFFIVSQGVIQISSTGAAPMLINKKYFDKYCQILE